MPRDGLPHIEKWELSETVSTTVHCVLLLCRPMLATGAKSTALTFIDASGAPATQRWIETKMAQLGEDWSGVPRLGPHALCLWLSWMVDSGLEQRTGDKRQSLTVWRHMFRFQGARFGELHNT